MYFQYNQTREIARNQLDAIMKNYQLYAISMNCVYMQASGKQHFLHHILVIFFMAMKSSFIKNLYACMSL